MRIIATLAVIFLHTCSMIWLNGDLFSLTPSQAAYTRVGNILMNWCVPLFLMLTGALFLDPEKEITTKDILKKYCRRILLALLIFGIPFSWLESITTAGFSWSMFPQSLLNLLTEQSWGHLWYLYVLLAIYLTLPVWKGYIKNSSRKTQCFVIIVLLMLDFVRPLFSDFFQISILEDMHVIAYPLFYLFAGWYLKEGIPRWLRNKTIDAVLLVLSLGAMIAVYFVFDPMGFLYLYFYSPLTALVTILIFVLLLDTKGTKKMTKKLWGLDRLCFCVYLIHPVFTNFFYKYLNITPLLAGDLYWLAFPGFFIGFSILAFAVAWVLCKIPPLRKYVL